MTYARTHFRERIVLNQLCKDQLRLEGLPPGDVLIAAREVTADGTFDIQGRNLVIVADRFDGSHGSISVNGPESAPRLTVACRHFRGLRASAPGIPGATGAPGQAGFQGQDGFNLPFGSLPGFPGGPGGAGQPGGKGGQGGTISVVLVTDETASGIDRGLLTVPGGPGGTGGAGGVGGAGGRGGGHPAGPDGPPGPTGADGPRGVDGDPGTVEVSVVQEGDLWPAIASLAAGWPAYRLKLGEYYFRAANPAAPPRSGFLKLAIAELTAVALLEPANGHALTLRNRLANNQNALGLARDIDITPNFTYYEEVVGDYSPLVLGLFQTVTSLLQGNLTLEQMAAGIAREIAHLRGLEVALEIERAAAERGLAAAHGDQEKATELFTSFQARITAKRAELESKTFGWVDFPGVGGYTAVVAIISLATDGAAAAVAGAYLPQIISTLTDGGRMPFEAADRAATLDAALGLQGLLDRGGKPDPLGPMLLSLSKLLSDIDGSDGDAPLKAMLRESVELTFDKLISARRVEQAELSLASADQRLQQARIDRELAQTQFDGLTTDVHYLEQVALTLVRGAKGYMDILMRYARFAARSVEIYTIDDLSNEVFCDYGYVHPDLEQDYADGMLPLAQLIGAYVTSWSQFVGVAGYRNRYEAYFAGADRVSDKLVVSVTEPVALADFRATQTLTVDVRLGDLPSTRFEAKATYILLALTGATANIPAISVLVEHGGETGSTMRDGSVQLQLLRPRTTVVQTAKTGDVFSGTHVADDPDELSFWGRGMATTWRITIEPEEMTRRQIDLSGLTAVDIEIGYDAFL